MSKGAQNVAIVLVVLAALLVGNSALKRGNPTNSTPTAQVTAPVPGGKLTSGFGRRAASGPVSAEHNGVDIAAPTGAPIRAVSAGTVIVARPASGFGLWMQVRHADGTVSVYGHMDRMLRPVGARVKAGEQIATVGARGEATGPHLHLEIWPGGDRSRVVDPKTWFAQHKAALTSSKS